MLEIDSGSGWFLATAVALGFAEEGVGVDPAISDDGTSIDEIRTTESAIKRLGLNDRVHFRICTFEDFLRTALPKSEKYDLLVFRNTLHHLYPRSKQSPLERELLDKCIKDLRSALGLLNAP
ncbi:MAG: class I SAM-dependent methyltransferase, partial [Nitrososphaerota archaeon]